MLLGGDAGHRLEPVREVRGALFDRPVFHGIGHDARGIVIKTLALFHRRLHLPPGKNSRKECACFMTADIGAYNTCGHLCRYCYANYSKELVTQNMRQHDPQSPFLIGHSLPGDVIHQAQQESWVENQLSLFDFL